LISDVMIGRLDMSVSTFTNFHSALVNRQARAIAVTSRERWPLNPDVAPAADDVPGYEVVSWLGLAARPACRPTSRTSSPKRSRSR
jgi:tripartite-type tricarboxylate transporter receptor subunit TctC